MLRQRLKMFHKKNEKYFEIYFLFHIGEFDVMKSNAYYMSKRDPAFPRNSQKDPAFQKFLTIQKYFDNTRDPAKCKNSNIFKFEMMNFHCSINFSMSPFK